MKLIITGIFQDEDGSHIIVEDDEGEIDSFITDITLADYEYYQRLGLPEEHEPS